MQFQALFLLIGAQEFLLVHPPIRDGFKNGDAVTVANLAILLGALGKEAGGLFPVDEKNNTLGLLDAGIAPGNGGKDLWGIIDGIESGAIKALYLLGTNPLVAFPENGRIRKALEKLELLVVQDIAETETTRLAHVVFAASAAAEKDGTFTTPDGRVQCLQKAVNVPGKARQDLAIITDLINALTGEELTVTPAQLLAHLNYIGGEHGIGRVDLLENRSVGMKSRGVYETPGGTILREAHMAVEQITMDREVMRVRDSLIPEYARMIYAGYWFSPEREMIQTLIDDSQKCVNGVARVKLYKGHCRTVGRKSDTDSLFNLDFATFEKDQVYNQKDAEGFIKINSLRLRIRSLMQASRKK